MLAGLGDKICATDGSYERGVARWRVTFTTQDSWRTKQHGKVLGADQGSCAEEYHAIKWQNNLATNKIYTSMSTPFVGVSMAIHLGYKEIIIYGADYYNHKNFNPDSRATKMRFDNELSNFKELAAHAQKIGVSIFCGHRSSALSEVLKIKRS